jgi:hypothetical protein
MVGKGPIYWNIMGFISTTYKGTSGGPAISFSACDDYQVLAYTMVSIDF